MPAKKPARKPLAHDKIKKDTIKLPLDEPAPVKLITAFAKLRATEVKPATTLTTLFFDDPKIGLAKQTSHPRFRDACKAALFYDGGNEFAPFGSDAGSDTLGMLEAWFRRRRPGLVAEFITAVIRDWGFTLPDLRETRRSVVERWLADDTLSMYLPEVNQLLIAAAFGQVKITGQLEPEVAVFATIALDREDLSTAYYERTNPRWTHAPLARTTHAKVRAALAKLRDADRSREDVDKVTARIVGKH